MRIAVIGAKGKMGKLHANILESFGHDVERLDIIDGPINYDQVTLRSDAAVIATPTPYHGMPTLMFLTEGKPVLVEKPLSHKIAQAEVMVDTAEKLGVSLSVGYLGRFNPAFAFIRASLYNGDLRIERAGPKPKGEYGGVAVDHASHDIDLLRWTFGKDLRINLRYDSNDQAAYDFSVPKKNLTGTLEVRYLEPDSSSRIRLWEFQGEDNIIADLTNQRVWAQGVRQDIGPMVDQIELQARAWEARIAGQTSDICTGPEGLEVLKLTLGV